MKCNFFSIFIFFSISFLFKGNVLAQTYSISPGLYLPSSFTSEAELNVVGLSGNLNSTYGIEEVCIDITHTYLRDLTIWLVSPDGTEILLTEKNGGGGDNYTNTCFNADINNPSINDGNAPFSGDFLPEQSLGFFNTDNASGNGTWILKILDDTAGDDGVLNSFSITFGNNPATVPSAPNDECSSAIQLAVNNHFVCANINNLTISNASQSNVSGGCNFAVAQFNEDVWFKFTASIETHEFLASNIVGTSSDLIFELFSDSCGSLNSIFCHEESDHNFNVSGLIPGNTYFLRVAPKTNTINHFISFDICIKYGVPSPPSNDECIGAFDIPVGGSGCTGIWGSVFGATASTESYSCSANSGNFTNDIWFSFTASASDHLIFVSSITGINTDLDFQLSSGICGSLTQKFCYLDANQGSEILIPAFNLNEGTKYYLRVATLSDAPENTEFIICLGIPASAPINDLCENALELTQLANNCNIRSGTVAGAIGGEKGIECAVNFEDYFDDDVWYKFTPTSNTHILDFFNIKGSNTDLIFEVFNGSCTNLTPKYCKDDPNDSLLLTGLNVNKEYFIRVATYFEQIESTTFDIRIRHNNRIVCNTNNHGPGSLREQVENASAGHTINLDMGVNNQALLLNAPLEVSKNLILDNPNGANVIFKNIDPLNTDDLLIINAELQIKGPKFDSTSPGKMKVRVQNGGILIGKI